MILSQTAVYALRALSILRQLAPAENLAADELSARTTIPRHYLNKVMQQLVAAEIVIATRGRHGGFRLARPAKRIWFAQVLDAVNMDLNLGNCVFRAGECDATNPCELHGVWSKLQQCVATWSNETTLADLDTAPN